MAETENKRSSCGNTRMNKKSTRVDLTPMVDLGFLLITFFVFTTSMALPKTMGLMEPMDSPIHRDEICNSCVLTLILGKNGHISYYEGMPENTPLVKQTSFTVKGIRDVLLAKKEKVRIAMGDTRQFVLIIKPGAESTLQNFVDIMDEVAINDIKHYYVTGFDAADKKLLGLP